MEFWYALIGIITLIVFFPYIRCFFKRLKCAYKIKRLCRSKNYKIHVTSSTPFRLPPSLEKTGERRMPLPCFWCRWRGSLRALPRATRPRRRQTVPRTLCLPSAPRSPSFSTHACLVSFKQSVNEIAPQGAVKSSRRPDEIVRSALDEIKSVLKPDEVGFYRKAISSAAGGFIPSIRTDLVEKASIPRGFSV